MLSYYTYGRMPSAEDTVYGLGGLDEDRVYIPRGEPDVILPGLPAGEGPIEEFVGTPYMPSFPAIPVAPPAEERVFVPREEAVPVAPIVTPAPLSAPVEEERSYIPRDMPEVAAPVSPITDLFSPAPSPEGFDPNAPLNFTPEQVKSLGNAMALAGLVDPKAFGNMYVGDAAFGGGPPMDYDRYARNVASGSVGGQGSFYEEGALEAAKAAAQDPYSGLFGQNLKDLVAQDPSLQPMVEAKVARDLEQISKVEQDYDVMKPLSDLLKANKFQEAFAYAKEQGLTDRLLKADWLSQLRQPFTSEEMQQFYNAIPPDYAGSNFNFDPQGASKRALTSMGATPQWAGYPDPQAAFVRKDDKTVENLAKIAGVAMLAAGFAPALAGAGGAGGAAGASGGAGALTGVVPTGVLPGSAAATLGALPTFPIVAGGGITAGQLAAAGALGAAGAGGLGGGTTTTAPVDNLAEIVVTGTKPTTSLLGPGTLASTSLMTPGSVSDIPTDIYGRVTEPVDTVEPPQEEVVITTKPLPVVSPVDLAAVGGLGVLNQTLGQQVGYQRPGIETTPTGEQGLPEVVVTGTKPPALDIADVALGLGGAGALTAGFTQPQVDPFTGELKEPPKTQQELDAIAEALKKGTPIPGTASVLDQLKSILEKASTARKLANLLQSLGLLGAGAAVGGRGTAAPSTGAGGFGGALPKYQFQRTQLQPTIDYYNYGMGPEAKFFEDTMSQVETTRGPDASVVNPEDEPRFAHGGLTNYAKGGSHSPRYVAGPGSGREDKIPALLSDGEYVIDAETLALLGDGSPKEGAARMDKFRAKIRQHKGRALSRGRISPNAKSPDKYMGGGLTR